jgi:glc operon protein GlcG
MRKKHCLQLEDVKEIGSACEQEALSNGWAVSIAVVDDAGYLMWLHRLDNALLTSVDIAIGKARTAALGRRSTKLFEESVNKGQLGMLTLPGKLTRLEGGEPITVNGEVVGAVGVSGVKSAEDAQIARAGIQDFLARL